ncbi:MAG: TrbI/VirB10 family protein, partial [Gammaproteobacteria bacterium]
AKKLKERNLVSYETRKKDIEAMIANMNAQADLMNKNLSKVPTQTFIKAEENKQNTESTNGSPINSNLNPKKFNKNDIIIKSGTILFGVIDTKVNSDEPGPILAKIVHGSLKGTTLIGNIQNNSNKFAEGLSINFKTANIPDKIKSYSISAMALDPDTARTAIASDVDHHYLLRWGSVFAASFLKGYSKSIADTGNTVQQTINPLTGTTNVTTTTNPLSSKKAQIYQGLSDVASTWSSNVSNFTDRAPTITIDPGTSIGIMLTADFVVPANDDLSEEKDQLATGSNNPKTMVNPDLGSVKNNIPQTSQVSLNNNNTTDNKNLNPTSNNNQNFIEDGANTRR